MVTAVHTRLVSLRLSLIARNLADACIWMVVLTHVANTGSAGVPQAQSEVAWLRTWAAFLLPFIVLAPVHGLICSALPSRWVLAGASGYCLISVVLLALMADRIAGTWAWLAGLSIYMIGAAVSSAARNAILPAAAQDTKISLHRINGWFETGGAAALGAGLLLGVPQNWLGRSALVIALNLLALLAAWLVRFDSDLRPQEPKTKPLADFFRDAGRVWADRETRYSLLGLAFFMALVVAGGSAIAVHSGCLDDSATLTRFLIVLLGGSAAGSLLASVQVNPYRGLGLITLGSLGMFLALLCSLLVTDLTWPAFFFALSAGLTRVPLRTAFQSAVPARVRGNAMAFANAIICILTLALMALLFSLLTPHGQLVVLLLLCLLASVICGWQLMRPTNDQLMEFIFWPMFRIHAYGPGKQLIPERGPLVVIGNHTAWFDPAWVTKITPRKVRAMMTSEFYDRPVMHFLMKYVYEAIRVQSSRFRREAPELQEAIRLVQADGMLLLFPEGWMRRKEERLLRQFGQGIWHILKACPNAQVVALWIEGGWGSYTSYAGGPPTQNKKPDFWRRIDIAVQEPIVLPPEILADHRQTRKFLWQRVLEARKYLGLDVPELPAEEEDDKEDQKEAV